MPDLVYTNPTDIDGEPAEVAELALIQLEGLLAWLARLASDTTVQVRNAWMTQELSQGRDERLGERWIESAQASGCIRTLGAIRSAQAVVAATREATQP